MDGAAPLPEDGVATVRRCDVMVIGGGPGGAATAAFLALKGHHVVLVEKDRHPRFHIGESLLPRSLPLLEELGMLDQVRRIGVFKPGAEFISEDGSREAVFDFRNALLDGPTHAYQVRRSEFDQIIFERAIALGVEARQQTMAHIVSMEDDSAKVRTEGADGEIIDWEASFLVDASGRSTLISKMLSEKRPDPRNTSAAIFGHFRGVPRSEGERGGNIRIYLTRPGWMWQIPLRDDVTSIGFVASGEHLQKRDSGVEAFFKAHCARHPHIASILGSAERIGPMHATGNFSYRATTAAGSRHIKVGDAYGFIDPIFSTGVHLALTSAREAASAITDILADPSTRTRRLAQYHQEIERRLTFVSWFIYQIHDPSFREMMVNPRNILGVESAMISLLSGDFRPDIRIRSRIALFRLFRYIVAATGSRERRNLDG
ncbi:tryptophan 7-halogenase [Limibaculum sp. M0105]|uniref:Tryptophan 7-halogenase n=1 Tax=Thermohalobaculum xanthum TaxID=2753746 RepID=A0A8J7M903_9RHOB|nr:NAD(P)/FAD-dependent oxidoreductase [Thermohalobaculum xanthum]MBK0400879.1 tryptophan 7-halogenase [Thermohalobaculum xanthum]